MAASEASGEQRFAAVSICDNDTDRRLELAAGGDGAAADGAPLIESMRRIDGVAGDAVADTLGAPDAMVDAEDTDRRSTALSGERSNLSRLSSCT